MIIGITGPTGSGKSTVSKKFKSLGFAVISADDISRSVQSKGSECLNKLVEHFGEKILNSDASLNRKLLAQIVFADNKSRQLLNQITHPYIIKEILYEKDKFISSGKNNIVIDAALLFESKLDKICDVTLAVIASLENRLSRIIIRDNINTELARNRIKSQNTDEYYKNKADYIIYSDCSLVQLLQEIDKFIAEVID